MTSYAVLPEFIRSGFNHPRTYPELPPGYDWETQIQKYCPPHSAIKLLYPKREFGFVFCHRGLYDRAMKIPENSALAIENGVQKGLFLHEIDGRMGQNLGDTFLAHDEVTSRVTSKAGKWSSLNISEIEKTALVTRRFDLEKADFASSYQETDEKVPHMEDLLRAYILGHGHCLQVDLRDNDLPRAIAFYSDRRLHSAELLLKGYNFNFACCQDLKAAVNSEMVNSERMPFEWSNLSLSRSLGGPQVMMVFYSQPLIALALKAKGMDLDTASLADRSSLDFQEIHDVVMKQVLPFLEIGIQGLNFIPEIVHTGLGLGYNIQTKGAVNPLNGVPITDPEVVFESRVDRAMIDVQLELRREYPKLYFSSCTRLCEVRTSNMELTADTKTGRLKLKPEGERGISAKLRSIHGGLFPQSDLVVADDPFAEIAARTWIDEYAKLDRSQLLKLPFSQWLAQAEPEVVAAVNKLNGPFLPNTFDGPLDNNSNIQVEHPVS
jgi:hypothetical protein